MAASIIMPPSPTRRGIAAAVAVSVAGADSVGVAPSDTVWVGTSPVSVPVDE